MILYEFIVLFHFSIVWVGIDPQTAPPVLPPTVTVVERTGNNDAMVEFEPFSLGIFTIVYYIVNDTTTPYLVSNISRVVL